MDNVEETDIGQDWYLIIENIQERFKDRFKHPWTEGYPNYTRRKTCIICHREPNCLNKNNLSKKETKKMMYANYSNYYGDQ